jgi:hypothetical protein
LRAGDPLDIAVRLTARDPETGEERPVADATVAVTVAGPDGQSYEGALAPAGSGEYAGAVSVNGAEGSYSIVLVAETKEGATVRRSLETSLSAVPVGASSPLPPPTRVPIAATTPEDAGTGDGGLALVFVLGPVLLVGLAASWAGYVRFGRPVLHGYLQSTTGGRAYDLETRHYRTWWRRPLTIGGPHDDIDLGLEARWARIIAGRKGKCLLEAVSADGVVVDDHALPKGMRCRLYDGSEINLGAVALMYRSP